MLRLVTKQEFTEHKRDVDEREAGALLYFLARTAFSYPVR
jgi:hypothetical protein